MYALFLHTVTKLTDLLEKNNSLQDDFFIFYISLYCTYVPILEYATPAWSPYLKGDIDHVESVRYFTRRLFDRCGMGYLDKLDQLQLDSLEVCRIKTDLILYYKVLYNLR